MKKYIYLLIIGLLASFASCNDSEIDNMDANGKDEGNITLRIALPQNENRLLFNEYEEDGMPVIKTKFESGDVVYLYNAQGNILRDDDGVPVKFEYKKMQGNNGIFGTNNDGSGSISNSVTSGNYNAVLVGKAFTDSNVFDTSKKFDEILNELPASGTQIGSGTEAGLTYIQTKLGVFKANEARTFTEQPNGTYAANDVYNFTPQYSIVKLTLDEPIIPVEDVLLYGTNVVPAQITFTYYETTLANSKRTSFDMQLEGFTTWKDSEIYIPVANNQRMGKILVLAENKTDAPESKRVFYKELDRSSNNNPLGDGKLHTLNVSLSSKLYLKTLDMIPGIATYAPAGSTLTLWDGDAVDPTGPTINISRFTTKIRTAFNDRGENNPVNLNFPKIPIFPNGAGTAEGATYGCFRGVKTISSLTAPECTEVGQSAFQDCSILTTIDLPIVERIGTSGFNGCDLTGIIDMPTLIYVGSQGFRYNKNMTEFIAKNLDQLDSNYALANCPALENVYLPKATQIGGNAFALNSEVQESQRPIGIPTPNIVFTIGTEVIEGVDCKMAVGVFIGRFKEPALIYSNATTLHPNRISVQKALENTEAGTIDLILGEGFSKGKNKGLTQPQGEFKVTELPYYDAPEAGSENGKYYWTFGNNVGSVVSNPAVYGVFTSITIVDYPQRDAGELEAEVGDFENGGSLN